MNKLNKISISDAVPCSICGCAPIIQGGTHSRCGRLVFHNYKSSEMIHGNLSSETNGIPMGFTKWCYYFWSETQANEEGIPTIVKDWNMIHNKN